MNTPSTATAAETIPFNLASQRGFSAKIICDSINPDKNRVTTFVLTYPRFIHSEIMTHRAFSRNAASSRAIPIEKVIEQVRVNPAMPISWGKNGKGMQEHGSLTGEDAAVSEAAWRSAAASAIESAVKLQSLGLHKQVVNRVLEPFVWMTTLVTATQWENFFSLRLHKDAQPEFQALAHLMLREYLASVPSSKAWQEWHIPYSDRIDPRTEQSIKLSIATARAARVSYLTMDGTIDVSKDISLHNSLAENGHWSPFEHACQASQDSKGNFVGWKQYRHFFPSENRSCDLQGLLDGYEKTLSA